MSAVTDTIRKLLAIAEDPSASPHEREVAANRAATLMARHAITSLDLNTAHTEEITTTSIFVPGGPSTPSLAQVLGIGRVARASGARIYYNDRRRRYHTDTGPGITVHIAGFRTDLDTLIPLASSLIAQTALAWTTWRRSHRYDYQWMTPVERKELRAGYVYGYAEGVAQRIKSSRQEAVQERTSSGDTSTALVLRTKEQRLQDHMNSLNLGAPKHLTLDPAGVADGHDDGWASGLGSPTNKTLKDLNPNLITQ